MSETFSATPVCWSYCPALDANLQLLAKFYEKLNVNLTSVTTVLLSATTMKQRAYPKQVDGAKGVKLFIVNFVDRKVWALVQPKILPGTAILLQFRLLNGREMF